jgi:hypothetical protein
MSHAVTPEMVAAALAWNAHSLSELIEPHPSSARIERA